MSMTLPPRSAVAPQHTWNAESVFATPADWDTEFDAVTVALSALAAYKGRLAEGPNVLAGFVAEHEALARRVAKLNFYATMSAAVDTTDQSAASRSVRAGGLASQFAAAVAFAEPELLALGMRTLRAWIASEPRLAIYAHYAEDLLRQAPHVRSAEVEEVLGLAADAFRGPTQIHAMLSNADMQFPDAVAEDDSTLTVAQGTLRRILTGPDRAARRSAYESYTGEYLAHKNTLAVTLLTSVKQDVFSARVRGFESALHAALFPHNIPVEVFHNLIDTFRRHLPIWHRYWAVRRRTLGVDALYPYDIWAPLGRPAHPVSFEQAVAWIGEALAPLGDAYVTTLTRGCLEQRWVDRAPNQGKRQGAFSFGTYDTYPFIMMSYADDVFSMSTLAHELGHSLHSHYSTRSQPWVYSRYSLFLAEVASNFNQAMLRNYLLRTQDDPLLQRALIEEAMSNFHRYFFIMPTLARFELEVHTRVEQGRGLGADDLIALCADLFAEGYGEEMEFEREREGITWATFQHLYVAYYPYQYATGIAGAHALAAQVLDGDPGAAEHYLGFLKAGASAYALDVLRAAGVDLSHPEPVEAAFKVMAGYVDRLEELTAG